MPKGGPPIAARLRKNWQCASPRPNERESKSLTLTFSLPNGILIAMKLTLDKMSRLLVPKGLRDRFALKPGDELEVTPVSVEGRS
jgi:DNA-binding transcriptional regulator/RsmH inhibitor MraZ